jgi:Cytidine and deoxycytidylate deaminase zinc-binding region
LSKESGKAGEYPYAAVVCRDGAIVAESINRVAHDGDVTRHAEVVAISLAQKTLRPVSLDDCEMYVNSEPRSRRLPLARFRSRHTSYVSLARVNKLRISLLKMGICSFETDPVSVLSLFAPKPQHRLANGKCARSSWLHEPGDA